MERMEELQTPSPPKLDVKNKDEEKSPRSEDTEGFKFMDENFGDWSQMVKGYDSSASSHDIGTPGADVSLPLKNVTQGGLGQCSRDRTSNDRSLEPGSSLTSPEKPLSFGPIKVSRKREGSPIPSTSRQNDQKRNRSVPGDEFPRILSSSKESDDDKTDVNIPSINKPETSGKPRSIHTLLAENANLKEDLKFALQRAEKAERDVEKVEKQFEQYRNATKKVRLENAELKTKMSNTKELVHKFKCPIVGCDVSIEIALSCGHLFCRKCAQSWPSCAFCRKEALIVPLFFI